MKIRLELMTKEEYREYMKDFILDVSLFSDPSAYKPNVYDQEQCDATFDCYVSLGRVHLAIIVGDESASEIILKKINLEEKHCTMGISMKNDSWKGMGYGTAAEIKALEYAFNIMNLETVFADALLNNTRSQHVLKKVGFQETHTDEQFRYYRCDKGCWSRQSILV